MSEVIMAPLDRSAWLGLLWPAYNRGALWLYNLPEGLHGLREDQRRACHQPSLRWRWEQELLRVTTDPGQPDPQADISMDLRADEDGLEITLRVVNLQEAAYLESARFSACLRNASAWRFGGDEAAARTLVRREGKWISLADLFGAQAVTRARNMCLKGPEAVADEGIIVRRNMDHTHLVAAAWDEVSGLAANLAGAISCLHSDPLLGAAAPGETVERRGRVWFGSWGLDELADKHCQALERWRRDRD